MNPLYTIVAHAIHTESSIFGSNYVLIYDKIRIDTTSDIQTLTNVFSVNKLSDSDMRNIIYICISTKGESNKKIDYALDYIKSLTSHEKITNLQNKIQKQNTKNLSLKQKNVDLKIQCIELQQQITSLIKMCSNADMRCMESKQNVDDIKE